MKRIALAVAALVLAAALPAASGPLPKSNQIQGEGCVESGVGMHCLVLKDVKSGKLYNLLIKGAYPALGEGIEFTGLPHHGPTVCMQGVPVDVLTWARKPSLKCKQGPAPKTTK